MQKFGFKNYMQRIILKFLGDGNIEVFMKAISEIISDKLVINFEMQEGNCTRTEEFKCSTCISQRVIDTMSSK